MWTPSCRTVRTRGFPSNRIVFLANKTFIDANPAVKRLFEQIQIPIEDWNAAILRQHNGEDSDAAIRAQAQEWVSQHQQQYDLWVAETIKAAH